MEETVSLTDEMFSFFYYLATYNKNIDKQAIQIIKIINIQYVSTH